MRRGCPTARCARRGRRRPSGPRRSRRTIGGIENAQGHLRHALLGMPRLRRSCAGGVVVLRVRHGDDGKGRKGGEDAETKPVAEDLEREERLREAAPKHEHGRGTGDHGSHGSRGSRSSNRKGNAHATTGVTAPRSRPRAHVGNVGDDAATR